MPKPRSHRLVAALLTIATPLVAGCSPVAPETDAAHDPAGSLTIEAVRACLDHHPPKSGGLLFRTTKNSSDTFVGVLMMDLEQRPSRPATVGIAVYDDAALLEAYEERAREDPQEIVSRVRNAVVTYHGSFTGRLDEGRRWVRLCLGGD